MQCIGERNNFVDSQIRDEKWCAKQYNQVTIDAH